MSPVSITKSGADALTDILRTQCTPAFDTNGRGWGPVSEKRLSDLACVAEAGLLQISLPVTSPDQDATGLGALILAGAAAAVGLYETAPNTTWALTGTGDRTAANAFKALLAGIGWEPPESYCIAACKGWWKGGFAQAGRDFSQYNELLDLSVMDSFHRCNADGLITRDPSPGAIMFMQDGDSGSGHGVLVRSLDRENGLVYTREANTTLSPNAPASEQRNGGCVADKTRAYAFEQSSGLWCRGFLNPPA